MRIRVHGGLSGSADDIFPGGELPPFDINDFFELEEFRTSSTTFEPFQTLTATWSIVERSAAVSASNYIFSLISSAGVLQDDIGRSGVVNFAPYSNTLLRVQGRRRGGGTGVTIGQGIALMVDESNCRTLEIPSIIVDGIIKRAMSQLVSDGASIRLRRYLVPGTYQVAEREVTSTWQVGSIRYDLPLTLVLNNMFDGDLDVSLTARFAVDHEGDQSYLEVNISHSSNVDFSAAEDIFSLGNTSSVARTANRLLPLVLNCVVEHIEGEAIQAYFAVLAATNLRETHRLLAVRVVPLDNFSYLAIVLCPRPTGNLLGGETFDGGASIAVDSAVESGEE
jgi:hypothetical protein